MTMVPLDIAHTHTRVNWTLGFRSKYSRSRPPTLPIRSVRTMRSQTRPISIRSLPVSSDCLQYRHRLSLHVSADQLVPAIAHLGGTHRGLSSACVRIARTGRGRGGRERRTFARRHRCFRHQHNYRSRDSEFRCAFDEPAGFFAECRAAAIFGLGCGGGVAGLARAARFAQGAWAGMCCSSPSIFAAFVRDQTTRAWRCLSLLRLSSGMVQRASFCGHLRGGGSTGGCDKPTVLTFGEHTWRNTKHIMDGTLRRRIWCRSISPATDFDARKSRSGHNAICRQERYVDR